MLIAKTAPIARLPIEIFTAPRTDWGDDWPLQCDHKPTTVGSRRTNAWRFRAVGKVDSAIDTTRFGSRWK